MFTAVDLGVAFGGEFLFRHVSFQIQAGEKVALTGRNGAGKSTLFRVMAGLISPTEGQFSAPKGTRVVMLSQELPKTHAANAWEHAAGAFEETRRLEERAEQICRLLEAGDVDEASVLALSNELHDIQMRLQLLDAATEDERLERVLRGLGFDEDSMKKDFASLSGGWQMRAELARLLLSIPDLLLLDEPTNHLDIESILWLEEFMKTTPSAVILISHDREFLDNTTTRTLELSGGKIYDYPFPYTRYREVRRERIQQLEAARKNQEKEKERIQRNIDRFRYKATKASFAQTLIKKLERMEEIETEEEEGATVHFHFPEAPPSGKVVAEAQGLSKSFDGRRIFGPLDFQIVRGEKIAFIGRNGMGKTTLARILAGQLEGEGRLSIGHNVKIGFYTQDVASAHNPDNTVLKELEDTALPYDTFPRVRSILGAFLFSGDSVYKKTRVLSGGEKSRLALAKLLVQPFNFLILDEPTNHLDMASKEILKAAIKNFGGTVVVVSHDRDFLNGLCTRTWEFTPEGVKMHLDGVEEVLRKRRMDTLRDYAVKEKEISTLKTEPENSSAQRCDNRQQIKKLRQTVETWEAEIARLEAELSELGQKLSDPRSYHTLSPSDFSRYDALKEALDKAWEQWTQASEALAETERS